MDHGSCFMVPGLGPGNRPVYQQPSGAQHLGWPQNRLEKTSNFQPISKATNVIKTFPEATKNHQKRIQRVWEIQFLVDVCNITTSHANFLLFQSQTTRINHKKAIRERNLETSMNNCTFSAQNTKNKKWAPWIHQHPIKFKSGSPRILSCAPQCSRIFPHFPEMSKRRHQPSQMQMARLGTKNVRYVCKRTKNSTSRSQRAST